MTTADQHLCPGCFAAPATAAPCATCGFDPNSPRPLNALPAGGVLNRQFLIGRVLGHPGGFGITYLAFDQRLHKRVAIKEYLPRDLAARAADSTHIQPYSTQDTSLYQHGLEQFEREARILAQLDHPNIVRVMQFFEAHGSAYLVMDYYSGETLAEYLNRQPNGRMREADALRLIQPILDGLRAVHAKQLLHRDIKPANIYLARSSAGVRPILIDFGAARHAVGERSHSFSVVLTAGYAPFEQYSRRGKQDTWTDVYAAAAVLYRCLTGETPPDAIERKDEDTLKPASAFGISTPVDAALMAALALEASDRTQTIDAFRDQLRDPAAPPPEPLPPDPEPAPPAPTPSRPRPWLLIGLGTTALGALAGGVLVWTLLHGVAPLPSREPIQTAEALAAQQAAAERQAREAAERQAQQRQHGQRFSDPLRDGGEGPELVVIRAGSFRMGSNDGDSDEKPPHEVTISQAFALGRTEVTFEEYDRFCAATGRSKPADEGWGRGTRPVINVSWEDAQAYARWLSEQTGETYRLPSEAEWEYAARAGTTTAYWWGDQASREYANYGTDAGLGGFAQRRDRWEYTAPVGPFQTNDFGLHDMHGNVWEWVEDCWNDSYQGAPTDGSAWKQGECQRRVLRGGSWSNYPRYLRSANRVRVNSGLRSIYYGFRVARTLNP